jgi:hypothetical protein
MQCIAWTHWQATRMEIAYDLLSGMIVINKAEIQLIAKQRSTDSSSDLPRHSHDSLAAAIFLAKTNLESIGLVDPLSYWTFTDVFEENRDADSIFHGGT